MFKNASLILPILAIVVSGCSKLDVNVKNALDQTDTARKVSSIYIANEKTEWMVQKSDGQSISLADYKTLRKTNALSVCGSNVIDFVQGAPVYYGHIAQVTYPKPQNDIIVISFFYVVDVPIDIEPATTKLFLAMPAGSYPLFPPQIPTSSPVQVNLSQSELLATYFDTEAQTHVNKYRLRFDYSMSYGVFCCYQSYRTKISITAPIGCPDYSGLISTYTSLQNYTPNSYQQYQYIGFSSSNGSQHKATVEPGILLCGQHCHFPSMGSSLKHEVQFRIKGSQSWFAAQTSPSIYYTDLASHDIVVPQSGIYEIRSRGLVYPQNGNTPPVYSDWLIWEIEVL